MYTPCVCLEKRRLVQKGKDVAQVEDWVEEEEEESRGGLYLWSSLGGVLSLAASLQR